MATTMNPTIRISIAYLDWAHGPAAEDGHPPAQRIIDEHCIPGRQMAVIDLGDDELREELADVASIWMYQREDYPKEARAARRIRQRVWTFENNHA